MSFRKFSIYIAFLSVFILTLTGCSNSTDSSSSSTTTEKTTFKKSINSSTPVVWFYADGTNWYDMTKNELPTIGKDSDIYGAFVNQKGNSHFYTFIDKSGSASVTLKDFKNLTGQKLVDKVKKLATTERVQGNKLKVHITTDETGNNTKSETISYAFSNEYNSSLMSNPLTLSNSAVQGTVYNNLYLGFKLSGSTSNMLITPVTGEKATVELDK
ncbi:MULTISPECIES: hypothetical protein [Lactobacillaceae]|uniref:hypothetical protein n=1 Tax=Lactobacillaceae TaxID=33958 RepID=UPI001076755C|nr:MULTISPECIES: hypothetical protein [Lactobacillaceae]TFZ14928.1 hypothetical protein E2P75_10395 [Limosilactobacillus fermentum]TFZ24451.1 hypothetical protein E2P76_15150 [Lactiplantibacillus plantarum]